MLCSLALHCLLAPWLHVCCWLTLPVTQMVCPFRLSALVPWSLFNGLAGGAYLAGIHCAMLCAWFVAWHCNACLLHFHVFVVVLLHMFPSCCVGPCCALYQWPAFITLAARECAVVCMPRAVSCILASFRTWLCNSRFHCVCMFVVMLHHMWLALHVAPGCQLWCICHSTMRVQHVSVWHSRVSVLLCT